MGFLDFLRPRAPITPVAAQTGPTIGFLSGTDVELPFYLRQRAHDLHPGFAPSLASASTMPSASSGGLGGQNPFDPPTAPNRTVYSHPADPRKVAQLEYPLARQAAQSAALLVPPYSHPGDHSLPKFWRSQRYATYQDDPTDPMISHAAVTHVSDMEFFAGGGVPPVRITHVNKRNVSAWAGIQQWAFQQTNQRLNMRPGSGQLAVVPQRGERSVAGVKGVVVQGSGTRRIPAVFVPPSVS